MPFTKKAPMRYPEYFIEKLRNTAQISDIVGKRVRLEKKGKEYVGLCPFHNEKTPSFTVNNEKQFFHCFGCSAHGDAIGFIKDYEKLANYGEAIEHLARELGVQLPELSTEAMAQAATQQKAISTLEAVADFYEKTLMSEAGIKARAYIEKRGINSETLKKFRIGYAPDSYGYLKNFMTKTGISQNQLLEAGVFAKRDNGECYERFRGRLMFPIFSSSGKVIAFGGRLLGASENAPKYLNSPETEVFKKREVLFNLNNALKSARELASVILVEGYMDVVALAQSGIANVVATLGTAATTEHLQALWRICESPIICMDGDEAGKRAMLRIAEIAFPKLTSGKDLRFCVLPSGDDPDSLVQREGPKKFLEIAERATTLHETIFAVYANRYNLKNPNERAGLEQELTTLANSIEDANVKSHYRNYFRNTLREAVNSSYTKNKNTAQKKLNVTIASASENLAKCMFKLVVSFPQLLDLGETEAAIERLEFENAELEELKNHLLNCAHENAHENAANHQIAKKLLADKRILLPKHFAESLSTAVAIFAKFIAQHDLLLLENEYKTLVASSDEKNIERLFAVQQELKRLRSI